MGHFVSATLRRTSHRYLACSLSACPRRVPDASRKPPYLPAQQANAERLWIADAPMRPLWIIPDTDRCLWTREHRARMRKGGTPHRDAASRE